MTSKFFHVRDCTAELELRGERYKFSKVDLETVIRYRDCELEFQELNQKFPNNYEYYKEIINFGRSTTLIVLRSSLVLEN